MQRSHSMRRREFLRGLVVAGGGGLVCDGRIAAFASQEVRKSQSITPSVKPIRGLVDRDGRFFQPVRILLPPGKSGAAEGKTAVVRIDGVTRDQKTVGAGAQMLEIFAPAREVEREVNVTVQVAGSNLISGR